MIGHLTIEESKEILAENIFGHIGCNDGTNTYVYPTNYVYDGKYVYCHSMPGSKIMVMRFNKRVCLQVDVLKDDTNWKSVMLMGNYEELDNERERYYAMKRFVDHMLHLKITERGIMPEYTEQRLLHYSTGNFKPVIYRISSDQITGRYEQ